MNTGLIVTLAIVVVLVIGGAVLLGPDIRRYSRLRAMSRGWHR